MSLPQLAQSLAAKGRNGDTILAHINPQEAGILKLLGGSGTINPHTGLPEFGFFKDIGLGFVERAGDWVGGELKQAGDWIGDKTRAAMKDLGPYGPLILGAALGPAGMGLFSTALGTGLAVGGAYGLANHSLAAGLKAGLGAYGGANIMQQISSLGANAPSAASAPAQSSFAPGPSSVADVPASGATIDVTNPAATGRYGFGETLNVPTATPPPAPTLPSSVSSAADSLKNVYNQVADTASSAYDKVANTDFGRGIGQIVEDPKAAFAKTNLGYTEAAALGLPALEIAANKSAEQQRKEEEAARQKFEASQIGDIHDYEYDPVSMSYIPKGTRQVKYNSGETFGYTYDPVTGQYTRNAANGGIVALGLGGVIKPAIKMAADVGSSLPDYVPSSDGGGGNFFSRTVRPGIRPTVEAVKAEAERQARIGNVIDYSYDPVKQSFTRSGERQVDPTTTTAEQTTPHFAYDPMTQTYIHVAANGGYMGMNAGGVSDLGGYSDGGRMLRGPGDGVSDSIPAVIGGKQPARLADGEFVVPARIVSELGNGSSEAGARKLYAMMDRIQHARGKTVGKNAVAKNSRAEKYLPA